MISKGELITISKPFAYVLLSRMRGKRCETCLKCNNSLKKCTQCNFVFYCDKICQKKSWKDHKLECKSLVKIRPKSPPDYIMLLARIIRKLKRGGDSEKEEIGNVTRTFSNLMSHIEEVKVDKERSEIFRVSNFVLSQYLEADELPASEIVLETLGKIFINTITIIDEQASVALGIYLGFDRILFRSLKMINFLKILQIFINYIDLINTTQRRRKQLQEQFYFWCECPACCDTERDELMHSIRCTNSQCPNPIIPTKDEICGTCGVSNAEHIDRTTVIMKKLEDILDLIAKKNNEASNGLEIVLEEARKLLYPWNFYLFKGCDEMFEIYINKGNYEKALQYGVETLQAFRKYASKAQAGFGLQLAKIGKIQLLLNMSEAASTSLAEAEKELKFHYGENHPVYLNFKQYLADIKN